MARRRRAPAAGRIAPRRVLGGSWRRSPASASSVPVYVYLTLPDVRPLRTPNPTTTAFMELRGARGARPRRAAGARLALGALRPHLAGPQARGARRRRRCVLAARGGGLRTAAGIDGDRLGARRIRRAAASTITQQLAKNLYLSPSKNPMRKLRELIIARRLEAELTKERILELYLNVIEWGDGVYGAEAAARRYFHKTCRRSDTVGVRAAGRRRSSTRACSIRRIRAPGCCAGSR